MAVRLNPENIQPMHLSLHHLVAKAPWCHEVLLEEVRQYLLPNMLKHAPVVAWIVDDTGYEERPAFGRGRPSILRTSRQARKLPSRSEPVGGDFGVRVCRSDIGCICRRNGRKTSSVGREPRWPRRLPFRPSWKSLPSRSAQRWRLG